MTKKAKIDNLKRSAASVATKVLSKKSQQSNSAACKTLVQRSVKTGRFADGVKAIGSRDRAGLIKLADR